MINSNNKDKPQTSIFKILFGDILLLLDAKKQAWLQCLLFAGIATIIFGLTGSMSSCINETYRTNYFCQQNVYIYLIITCLSAFIQCMFFRNWIEIISEKYNFNYKHALTPNLKDLKIFGSFLLYVFLILVACGSFYLLYVRVPNPNWHIEIAYFTIVSVGFLPIIFSFRYLGWLGQIAIGDPLKNFFDVWSKTRGKFLFIFMGLTLIFLIATFFMMQFYRFVNDINNINYFLTAILIEFVGNFLKLIITALFANFCYIQIALLSDGEKHDSK